MYTERFSTDKKIAHFRYGKRFL